MASRKWEINWGPDLSSSARHAVIAFIVVVLIEGLKTYQTAGLQWTVIFEAMAGAVAAGAIRFLQRWGSEIPPAS